MLAIIKVYPFLEFIINLRAHMTGYDDVSMESQCVLLVNVYPVSDTWIVKIELKFNIFQVSTIVFLNNIAAIRIP